MSSNRGTRGASRGRGRARGSPLPSTAGSDSGFGGRGGSAGSGGPGPSRGQGPRGRGGGFAGGPPSGGPPRGFDARGRGGGGRGGPGGPSGGRGGRGGAFGEPPRVFAANVPAVVDNRLATVDQLVASFKRLDLRNEMPLRPGWGTLGRETKVRTNFFAVKMKKDVVVFDYDVSFSPKSEAGLERKARIFEILENNPLYAPHVPYVAHDRSQRIVSARKLPQPLVITVPYIEEGLTAPLPNAHVFTVEIKFVRELNMRDLNTYMEGRAEGRAEGPDDKLAPVISAFNLTLQQFAAKHGTRTGKNKYFFSALGSSPLGLGLETRKGFFLSVRPTYKQLMVNVNVCMTAFYIPGNLADAMVAFNRQSGGMPHSFYQRLKVSTTYLGYTRKRSVFSIASTTARQTRFQCDEFGGMVSVEDYFKKKYNITLRHAHDLPVINVSNKKDRPNYLPAELCEIFPDQPFRGKLGRDETSQMIRYACNPPHVNAESIVNQGLPSLGLSPNPLGVLGEFGITVDGQMTTVPARILPAPRITYKAGTPNVRDGSWNILDVKLHAGGNMTNWAVLLVQDGGDMEFEGPTPQLQEFVTTFAQKCRSSGLTVPEGRPKLIVTGGLPPPSKADPLRREAMEQIRKALVNGLDKNRKPSFVLVLLSRVDNFIYPGIKRLGDIVLGIHTVHMQVKKARVEPKKQDQYFSNVTLKVNAKLGGINHLVDPQSMKWLTEKRTMLVGIDVTHPSPTSKPGSPSIVAVVASVDDKFVHFPASLGLQKPDWNREAKEMVDELDELMVERLLLYKKKNKNALPERVFVYRDGVSEGQYDLVIQHELPKLLSAFKKISPQAPYRPKLTITICGKRHHARMWPTDPQYMDRKGNNPPGLVVDKGVTDIYNFDFYLQAHAGLQGQARPTHYVVIYDEQHYTADQLQQGTHTSSYGYVRATKAVSLVPPAYYADIACERGRQYIMAIMDAEDDKSTTQGTRGKTPEEEKERVYQEAVKMWGNGIHNDIKESMFYI